MKNEKGNNESNKGRIQKIAKELYTRMLSYNSEGTTVDEYLQVAVNLLSNIWHASLLDQGVPHDVAELVMNKLGNDLYDLVQSYYYVFVAGLWLDKAKVGDKLQRHLYDVAKEFKLKE